MRHGSFPIGLLDDVIQMLEIYEIKYTIKDTRRYPTYQRVELSSDIVLREYQKEAVSFALMNQRGVISLPTGSGKTIIALEIAKRLQLPMIFFVNRKELLYQTVGFIKSVFGEDAGMIGDGKMDLKPLTVAMIQTATGLPASLFIEFGLCFFDEVHHVPANTVYNVASKIECPYVFGLSATPFREDGRDLQIGAAIGPIIYKETLSSLIHKGFLAKPHICAIPVSPITFGRKDKYADVYRRAVMFNKERNEKIAAIAVDASVQGSTYIHVRRIDHGKILAKMIKSITRYESGKRVEFLCGKDKTKTRAEVLKKFKSGNLPILISTLLGEGFDCPDMVNMILATPIKSRSATQQAFGRLLRISECNFVTYYDCFDNCKYLRDHWLARVKFYRSEEEFILDDRIKNLPI